MSLLNSVVRKARKLGRDPSAFIADSRLLSIFASPESAPAEQLPSLNDLALQFGTDKSDQHHNYVRYYERYFSGYRDSAENVLEIGVKDGASLNMWKQYFSRATIVGVDNRDVASQYAADRIKVHVGLQQDAVFLNGVCDELVGPLDVILDDGSHHNLFTIASFEALFPRLAPGGVYAIEDLHCSYEQHGLFDNKRSEMIEFYNEILNAVDLNGRRDIFSHVGSSQDFGKLSQGLRSKLTMYERWIESVHFYQGLLFVLKRPADM